MVSELDYDPGTCGLWAQSEITALEEKHTWDVTSLPPEKHALGCKWVLKIKYNSDDTIKRKLA